MNELMTAAQDDLEGVLFNLVAELAVAERQVDVLASHLANNVPCWFCPLANDEGDCGAGTCVAKVCAWSREAAVQG